MRKNNKTTQKTLFFTQWSRKSYAVMASLGSYVQISRLSIDICKQSMLKQGGFLLLDLFTFTGDGTDLEDDDLSEDILCEYEFALESVPSSDIFYLINSIIIYKSLCFALG